MSPFRRELEEPRRRAALERRPLAVLGQRGFRRGIEMLLVGRERQRLEPLVATDPVRQSGPVAGWRNFAGIASVPDVVDAPRVLDDGGLDAWRRVPGGLRMR